MSHSQTTASATSYSNFHPIFGNALDAYRERTKKDLLTHPLVSELQKCDSPSAVLAVLHQQVPGLDRSRSSDIRWTTWLDPTVNVLHASSEALRESITLVFSPRDVIFAGVTDLFLEVKDFQKSHESLIDIFERIGMSFKRLETYTQVPPTTTMMDMIVQIMMEVLTILGIATKEMKQGRIKKYGKRLIGRTDMEDALTRLDMLAREEARMASAEILNPTHTVDKRVRGVMEQELAVDDRLAHLNDKVAGVIHGAGTNAKDFDQSISLSLTSERGRRGELLEHGADVGHEDSLGRTPLHVAAENGHYDTAQLLLNQGADLNAPEKKLQTPLHLSANQGTLKVAELLLECGAEVDARDEMDQTPLHFAAQQGHLDLVRLLLEHHADVLALNLEDHTFLDVAWASGHKEIVNVNERYEGGQTALHIAAQHGDIKLMSSLIHDTDPVHPNVEDGDKETPLFPSSRNGKLEATRLLLDAGANPNHRDWQEMTPLHGASEKGHVAVTQLLLDRSAEVNAEHVYRWTPLHLASQAGKGKAAEVLLGRGAMANANNDSAWTPLHIASQKGHLDVVELLLTNDADVNLQNEDGETALHLAAFYGHLEVAQVLLKNSGFLDSKNKEGKTAWDLALKEGHLDIAQLLRPTVSIRVPGVMAVLDEGKEVGEVIQQTAGDVL